MYMSRLLPVGHLPVVSECPPQSAEKPDCPEIRRPLRSAAKGLLREGPGHGRSVAGAQRSKERGKWGSLEYLRVMGPGLVTGASDDDPSGIATYAQAGAQFRFGLLWLTLLSLPLMSGVQEICDRTALATGQGLGELASRRFDLRARVVVGVLLVALMGANALNIAADLVAIGEGMRLLHAGPSGLWAALAGVAVIVLVVRGSFDFVARIFKILCLALFAYIAVLFVITVPWGDAFAHLLVPRIEFSRGYLALVVAVLGTTISPYLFFWQSAHRIEDLREDPERGDEAVSIAELPVRKAAFKQRASRLDVFTGMTLSQIVMFAIIVSAAATLN